MTRQEIKDLFVRYGPMVYRRARGILGNEADAEEATQEVFIKALRSGQGFEKRAQVSTWLYRITTNHCLNQLRNKKTRRLLLDAHTQQLQDFPTRRATPEQMVVIRSLLQKAPEDWARVAIYIHLDGLRHHEAAEVLGVSRRTVGNLLERFYTWARAQLNDSNEAPGDEK